MLILLLSDFDTGKSMELANDILGFLLTSIDPALPKNSGSIQVLISTCN